jgi:hypothetical protein
LFGEAGQRRYSLARPAAVIHGSAVNHTPSAAP